MRVLFASRVPVETTGTIAPPAALSVATWAAVARLQSNAGVAGLPPELYPEIAAYWRCVRKGLRAARVLRAIELARTTWREAAAPTHRASRARRHCQ